MANVQDKERLITTMIPSKRGPEITAAPSRTDPAYSVKARKYFKQCFQREVVRQFLYRKSLRSLQRKRTILFEPSDPPQWLKAATISNSRKMSGSIGPYNGSSVENHESEHVANTSKTRANDDRLTDLRYDWQIAAIERRVKRIRIVDPSSRRSAVTNFQNDSEPNDSGHEDTTILSKDALEWTACGERIHLPLSMTAAQLRKQLIQVVDPALKYSTLRGGSKSDEVKPFVESSEVEVENTSIERESDTESNEPHSSEPFLDGTIPASDNIQRQDTRRDQLFHTESESTFRATTPPTHGGDSNADDRMNSMSRILPGIGEPMIFGNDEDCVLHHWWEIQAEATVMGKILSAKRNASPATPDEDGVLTPRTDESNT